MGSKCANIRTSKEKIINYWIQFEDDCDLNFDWADADTTCWRCGCKKPLQCCYIIPNSLGGKDKPNNFVLLCADCCEIAPNIQSSAFMWDWIKSYRSLFYNTFWNIQAFEEYERVYHKSFIEELEERNILTDHAILEFWNLKTKKFSSHLSPLYENVSNITSEYKMKLEAFDAKYPSGKYTTDKCVKLEKDFEQFTWTFCELANKYNFSVWEGGPTNPHCLCMSTFFPFVR